ncbi:peptidoglycan synthetase FtsI [Streptomyces sp. WMMB 714]|uniref:peptidoglycan D,D-transpeptidase FtsI family protein n=1 Tax=Streptomyces sp. WMMB 714 TaxID=1286822 RepID=UPI0005F7DA40|nr:penicillin-binding protein 2 [Streptomyces sp. WMMB 714]SCK28209.1 peptidoglycan synthetase FtsI [Streptomyces sp. WMMB 714]
MSERPRDPRRTGRPASRPGRSARGANSPKSAGSQGRGAGGRAAAARPAPGKGAGKAAGRTKPVGAKAPLPSQGGRLRLARARPRLRLIAFGLTVVMLAFTVRLLQVQAVDASAFADKAAVNRYITVPLAAERGTISSRDGAALATTVDAYDVTADPYLFTSKQTGVSDAPERAAALLAPVLHEDEQELTRKLSRKNTRYVLLARQQTPRTWQQIRELKRKVAAEASEAAASGKADKAGKAGKAGEDAADVLAGVYREKHPKRVYPNRELASAVLGFVNSEGKGGAGVEAMLDKKLAGRNGKITYAQSGGRQVPTAGERERPARAGADVQLTLDRDIQWAAQQAIGEQIEESDADSGYVVVQDTRTGELLAMASAPGFDPNDISRADPAALGNAAAQDVYEPGSTSKLMSMAAVLEEGRATPLTKVTVPNRLKRADRAFADDVDHETWKLTLNGVLAKSSNIGTILATEQLGETQKEANKVLHRYLSEFGIGRPTGLGLPGATSGILERPEKWSASQQYTIPFGQGLSLNAVQAASIYSTIANGGVREVPSLVRGTTGPDGAYTPARKPDSRRVVSEKTARTLARMLESVVSDMEGTGTTAKIPGYRVAGKTGTANRVDPETGRYDGYTSSFAGFAPADKPRVTVYCAVQNPKKGSYFGSDVCGPVYKQVMKFALKSLQIPPTGAKADPLPVSAEKDSRKKKGR